MKVIRFEVEGFLNSFRVPFFRTYHKSLLAPPKTTIIGMLCNISLKSQKEFFDILNEERVSVSVVIDKIEGKAKDLWVYKTLVSDNRGRSVLQRDRLFKTNYIIYLKFTDDELFNDFYKALKSPKNTPSLGMDDELIYLKNITDNFSLQKNKTPIVDSIFLDKGYKYKVKPKDITKAIVLPTFQQVPTKFIAFDKKGKRVPREPVKDSVFNQVEFINCEIEFESKIESFVDNKNNRIIFY
jgi:CRISPR-associated protein Cas5t